MPIEGLAINDRRTVKPSYKSTGTIRQVRKTNIQARENAGTEFDHQDSPVADTSSHPTIKRWVGSDKPLLAMDEGDTDCRRQRSSWWSNWWPKWKLPLHREDHGGSAIASVSEEIVTDTSTDNT